MREHVWMVEENVRAELVWLGAFVSKVRYTKKGIDYEVIVDNDEFEYWEERVGGGRKD